ncbi:hypothetical protein [Streptacidiphilus jiangxiensis]|uniref:Uncharacterized protein n=1 Tax=Streptacidiphilus jiangxiensis TaxID=235985 RepID=A0A1H7N5I1_STRJI|nr:hypothetical protein [Streptacidiphilus jiangxiensis]SEL18127.1 hypothetical protein SAMN05414137_106197 [Streptacidiphilus jiangxiensis]
MGAGASGWRPTRPTGAAGSVREGGSAPRRRLPRAHGLPGAAPPTALSAALEASA